MSDLRGMRAIKSYRNQTDCHYFWRRHFYRFFLPATEWWLQTNFGQILLFLHLDSLWRIPEITQIILDKIKEATFERDAISKFLSPLICSHECMYRGRPLWRCPWDRAFQLGLGEGPIGLVGPISQPRGTNDTASLTLDHTYARQCSFWAKFTLGSLICSQQAMKGQRLQTYHSPKRPRSFFQFRPFRLMGRKRSMPRGIFFKS